MPVFRVRKAKDMEIVKFFGGVGGNGEGHLKPEEIGRAIISEPIKFDYESKCGDGVWPPFATALKGLVTQAPYSRSIGLGFQSIAGQNQYRMMFISDATVEPEDSKDLIERKMKLKLVSNIPLNAPRLQREHGCLVQLARLCGSQNVNIRIKDVGSSSKEHFPWMETPCMLSWNEEELSWEGETQVTLKNVLQPVFESTVARITSQIQVDGVTNVLRRVYGGPGDNWKLQKKILEQGQFSDLEVISLNPKNKKNPRLFQCHRVKLAEASPVFADMLLGNWEEAQRQTIKLPESETAIEVMLRFIYYGGTEWMFKTWEEPVLELLQAGHKYNIKNLEEVAAFVLLCNNGRKRLSVETALQTFFFVRNVEGHLSQELGEHCLEAVRRNEKWLKKRSKSWRELVAIAKKFGPEFSSLLNNLFSDNEHYTRKYLPGRLTDDKGIRKKEAELFYDILMVMPGTGYYTWDVVVAMFMLAEYLGRSVKEVDQQVKREDMEHKNNFTNLPLKCYQVDYLVELFCLARKREGECWKEMKMEAVKKLREYQTTQPEKIKASMKFSEMIEESEEAAKEFGSIKAALELEEEEKEQIKKRRLN